MTASSSEDLIDRVYEAAVVPEQWPGVLDAISTLANGIGGLMHVAREGEHRWLGTEFMSQIFREYVKEGWPERNDGVARLLAANHAGFLNDLDVYTREEWEKHPLRTEFMVPRGLGWRLGTVIPIPSGDMIAFELHRSHDSGPADRKTLERLDAVRPHLARASLLSGRLALERARTVALALELVGLPAAVIGNAGRPLAVNAPFEPLMPQVVHDRRDRLHVANASADRLFATALSFPATFAEAHTVRSIPVPATETEPAMILHLIPVCGTALDLFSGARAILVVTPVVPKTVPTAEVIQGLFDLTAAEARVARAIAEGRSIEEMATSFRVSQETVRSQVRSVLAKTGLGRRSDLATLLAGTRL